MAYTKSSFRQDLDTNHSATKRWFRDLARSVMTLLSDDTTPILGGNLDLNGYTISDSTGSTVINDSLTVGAITSSGAITSTVEQTDKQVFLGINDIIAVSAGTWTITRNAQADYVYKHTAAANTTIMAFDLTPKLRTTASKGFKLTSFDVIYKIGTLALNAHTVTLDKVTYANNAATTVSSVALTGSLATATQSNPYVTGITVTSPSYDNTTDSKYVIELTINAQATSAYEISGIVVYFSENSL